MAETQENPILAFFSNLFGGIKPPLPKNDASVEPANVAPVAEPVEKKPVVSEDETVNPSSVKLPEQELTPLKLETDSVEAAPNTNPLLLWQVYAIGGFFILRWAWTRKGRKKSDNEPPTNPDDL